jgi:glucans biosynthesis protein C
MKRIYYVDWLRISAIIVVFLFHSSHFFDPIYWHVKNPQTSESVLLFLGFVNIWIMPLFFFLSGASAMFGLKKPFPEFAFGKVTRLLVPLVMGALILIPPQKYVEAVSHNTFSGGFIQFLGVYFSGRAIDYPMGFSPLWIGALSYHLWFLGHLLIISLALFPLLRWISKHGSSILDWLEKVTSFTGGAILFFLPIAVERVLLKKHFPEYTGWCDLIMYSLYFLLGFIFTKHDGLKQSLFRSRNIALIVGTILFVLYISSFAVKGTFLYELFQNNKVPGYYVFQETAGALATWTWMIFIVSMGMKYLDRESVYRQQLNEAVLPFYILHQTVLLLIGFIVVKWDWSSWGKWGLIASSSMFVCMLVYMLAIRPFNPMRFLFGMEKKKQ